MPGQDRRVWAVAAELCQCLRAHLTFAFVDPASYLVELTPGQVILPLSLDPVIDPEDDTAAAAAELTEQLGQVMPAYDVSWSLRTLAGDRRPGLGAASVTGWGQRDRGRTPPSRDSRPRRGTGGRFSHPPTANQPIHTGTGCPREPSPLIRPAPRTVGPPPGPATITGCEVCTPFHARSPDLLLPRACSATCRCGP